MKYQRRCEPHGVQLCTAVLSWIALSTLNPLLATSATAAQTAEPMNSSDAAAFADYLQRHNLTPLWQGNPAAISSDEIRAAYPDVRFYYTYRRPPNPPGAITPELQQRYDQQLDEYRAHSLRLTIGIDWRGEVRPYREPDDFNIWLAPITTEQDARVAAAAILSLIVDENVAPGVIPAKEITVTATSAGWVAHVAQLRGVNGKVEFDQRGRCVAISKRLSYSPPVPP